MSTIKAWNTLLKQFLTELRLTFPECETSILAAQSAIDMIVAQNEGGIHKQFMADMSPHADLVRGRDDAFFQDKVGAVWYFKALDLKSLWNSNALHEDSRAAIWEFMAMLIKLGGIVEKESAETEPPATSAGGIGAGDIAALQGVVTEESVEGVKTMLHQVLDDENLKTTMRSVDAKQLHGILSAIGESNPMLKQVLSGIDSDAIQGYMDSVDVDAIKTAVDALDTETLKSAVGAVDTGMLQSMLGQQVNTSALQQMLGSIDPGMVQGAIQDMGQNLDGLLGQISPQMVQQAMGAANSIDVNTALGAAAASPQGMALLQQPELLQGALGSLAAGASAPGTGS